MESTPWMSLDKRKLYELVMDCQSAAQSMTKVVKRMDTNQFKEMMAAIRKQSHHQTIPERKLGTAKAHLEQRHGECKEKTLREAHQRGLQALRHQKSNLRTQSDFLQFLIDSKNQRHQSFLKWFESLRSTMKKSKEADRKRIESLEEELSTLKKSNVAISELSRIKGEPSDLQARFEALKKERNDLMAERTELESKLQCSEAERQRLKQRLDEARERQAESDEHVHH